MGWVPDLIATAYTLAILIIISSIPSIWSLVTGKWLVVKSPNHDEVLHEDEDGAATTESTKEFSNKAQFIIIFAATVLGLAFSIANLVFLTTRKLRLFDGLPPGKEHGNNGLGIVFLVPAWVISHLRHSE